MNSTFINQLADHIKEKYNLCQEELTVVFPNKRAAFYLRSRFQQIYEESIWLPQMLSVEEAMTEWSGISLADNLDILFELIAINSEIKQNDADLTVFGGMAAQMTKDFDEIDQYAVDAQHLFSYIEDAKHIGVWNLGESITIQEQAYLDFFKNLKEYYLRLRQRLNKQGKGYYGMITRSLSELEDTELATRVKGRKIIFAGFNALTPTEQVIIDKLYKLGLAEVIWDFDRYYVEDKRNEAGYFARKYIQQDLRWKPTSFTDSLLNDKKEIHMVGVSGNTIQAKALQSYLNVEQDPNMSIILADENLLIPVLNSIPDDDRYPSIKVSMGYPLQRTTLTHLMELFFQFRKENRMIRENGWYIWPIYKTFDLEITRIIFSKEELTEIDIFRKQAQKKSLFIFKQEDFVQTCHSHDVQEFMKLLMGLDKKESDINALDILNSLKDLLGFLANKLQKSENVDEKLFLLNQISVMGMTVNRLMDIVNRYQNYVSKASDLEILFRLVSSNVSIKLNNSTTTGLQVMGLLEARNLDFDCFYMLGVNEGILPTGKPKGSFIPYDIRKECGLPGYEEKQSVYAYHFYRLLQGCSKVYYLYNSSTKEAAAEPSRFLLQLKYELAKRNSSITFVEETFNGQPEPIQVIPALVAKKNEDVMSLLRQKLISDSSQALAPTSLSTYIACPLKFYFKFLMRIDDDTVTERTQSNVIGNVIHNTLQYLYDDFKGIDIDQAVFNNIEKNLETKKQQAIHQTYGQGLWDVGYNYLDRVTIESQLQSYMKYEREGLGQGHRLKILDIEHTFSTTLDVRGCRCVIGGKADRIDTRDGKIRIIDYKTGEVENKNVIVADSINSLREVPEKALQLLIYKYLYLKSHPEINPDQVTASIFGLRYEKIVFDLVINYQPLQDDFIGCMEAFLVELLEEMLDENIPFAPVADAHNSDTCKFCLYRSLCSNASEEYTQEDDH